MEINNVLKAIYDRRSVRTFLDKEVDNDLINEIIKAGSYAPSGLNNQPWRFVIIKDTDVKTSISKLTHYSKIILSAKLLIGVMLDKGDSYHREKDIQAVGACIQNMLLAIHSLDLGAVWLGEILKSKEKFNEILSIDDSMELMAVIALGHKSDEKLKPTRKDIKELIIKSE